MTIKCMRNALILSAILWSLIIAGVCYASPFIVCDAYLAADNVDYFVVTLDSGTPVTIAAEVQADLKTRMKYDIGSLTVGNHSITVKARNSLWGLDSVSSAPFAFSKPAAVSTPAAMTIVK